MTRYTRPALLTAAVCVLFLLSVSAVKTHPPRSVSRQPRRTRSPQSAYVWGRFSTTLFGRTSAQRHNIALAASFLDEVVLSSGEVFSFAEVVGPTSRDRGFRKANAIRDGELSPEFGGGICQLSSTVYNAALLANLKIVERHRHLWQVRSVPPGLDAAVAYGHYDLKFQNDGRYPLVLHVSVEGDRMIASLTCPQPNPTRVRINRRYTEVERKNEWVVRTPSLDRGDRVVKRRGKTGCRVLVERIAETAGQEPKAEVVSEDYYPARDRVVLVGIAE